MENTEINQSVEELRLENVELKENIIDFTRIMEEYNERIVYTEDVEEICQELLSDMDDLIEEWKKSNEDIEKNNNKLELMKIGMVSLNKELAMNRDWGRFGSDTRRIDPRSGTSGLDFGTGEKHNIEHPLCERILIENLASNVGTEKIYEVFGMAGKITWMDLRIDKEGKSKGICVLQYSHPVEAVQAIAMFNGQKLYDQSLVVKRYRFERNEKVFKDLPEGLTSIGMGLGVDGAPLPNVSSLLNIYTWQKVRDRVRENGDIELIDMISKISFD